MKINTDREGQAYRATLKKADGKGGRYGRLRDRKTGKISRGREREN